MEGARKGWSNEARETGKGRGEGGREQDREGYFKGGTMRRTLAGIQCTDPHTTRPLILWYYK